MAANRGGQQIVRCPACGAAMPVRRDAPRAVCPSCGAEHSLTVVDGIVTARPVITVEARVVDREPTGSSRTERLQRDLDDLNRRREQALLASRGALARWYRLLQVALFLLGGGLAFIYLLRLRNVPVFVATLAGGLAAAAAYSAIRRRTDERDRADALLRESIKAKERELRESWSGEPFPPSPLPHGRGES
jgi:hypothetical protein